MGNLVVAPKGFEKPWIAVLRVGSSVLDIGYPGVPRWDVDTIKEASRTNPGGPIAQCFIGGIEQQTTTCQVGGRLLRVDSRVAQEHRARRGDIGNGLLPLVYSSALNRELAEERQRA